MRNYDLDEAARLLAEPWMIEQLTFNPQYVSWGPDEDYMIRKGEGWDTPLRFNSWTEFGPIGLDELNEIVHFYFSVERPSRECDTCGGNGTHPDSQWISESFYEHSSPFRAPEVDAKYAEVKRIMAGFGSRETGVLSRGTLPPEHLLAKYGKPFSDCCVRIMEHGGYWADDITEDEAAALVEGGRGSIGGLITAADFNRANAPGRSAFDGHDAINRWILIEQRLKRLGMPQSCEPCEGHGYLYTGPARLDLILWLLHPRKGCSRGVEVQDIKQTELPKAYAYLKDAATRNAARFSKLP